MFIFFQILAVGHQFGMEALDVIDETMVVDAAATGSIPFVRYLPTTRFRSEKG